MRSKNHGSREQNKHGVRIQSSSVESNVVHLTGKLQFNTRAMAAYLAARIPQMVITRTKQGFDVKGRQFKAYSASYMAKKVAAGRSPLVNLWLTGATVGSFQMRASKVSALQLSLLFAPDGAQSAQMKLVPGGTEQTGRATPPHNILGWYHHRGLGKNPKRKWMGLTPQQMDALAKEVTKVRDIWQLR